MCPIEYDFPLISSEKNFVLTAATIGIDETALESAAECKVEIAYTATNNGDENGQVGMTKGTIAEGEINTWTSFSCSSGTTSDTLEYFPAGPEALAFYLAEYGGGTYRITKLTFNNHDHMPVYIVKYAAPENEEPEATKGTPEITYQKFIPTFPSPYVAPAKSATTEKELLWLIANAHTGDTIKVTDSTAVTTKALNKFRKVDNVNMRVKYTMADIIINSNDVSNDAVYCIGDVDFTINGRKIILGFSDDSSILRIAKSKVMLNGVSSEPYAVVNADGKIESGMMPINGRGTVTLTELKDITFIPVRYVAKKYGANVLWIPSTNKLQITK